MPCPARLFSSSRRSFERTDLLKLLPCSHALHGSLLFSVNTGIFKPTARHLSSLLSLAGWLSLGSAGVESGRKGWAAKRPVARAALLISNGGGLAVSLEDIPEGSQQAGILARALAWRRQERACEQQLWAGAMEARPLCVGGEPFA